MIEAMDYHSMQMSGGVGVLDDGMVQQRLRALARQRDALARERDALTRQGDEVQQMEIELKAQVIARSEILELQNNFEIQMKVQVDLAIKLQEELSDREQNMHDLERKIEDQERELHAMRLDNEKAWAKENLLWELISCLLLTYYTDQGNSYIAKVTKARALRKTLGGGMRQIGILGAIALFALKHNAQSSRVTMRMPND